MEYKYNYVIFNSPDNKLRVDNDGYYTICTKDLENLEQTRVVRIRWINTLIGYGCFLLYTHLKKFQNI